MSQEEILLVSTTPQPVTSITQEDADGRHQVHPFAPSSEHGGLKVLSVPYELAYRLIRATPHAFYPFYDGLDPKNHFDHCTRETLGAKQVAAIIESPKELHERLLTWTPPEEGNARPGKGEEWGTPAIRQQPPEPDTQLHGGTPEKGKIIEDRRKTDLAIPETAEELHSMHMDRAKMILSLETGTPIEELFKSKKTDILSKIADLAKKRGHPIDGWEYEEEKE